MKTRLLTYLLDAISRAESGGVASPSGSWLAGMFGKAANLFEKEVSHYVAGLLASCTLSYPADFGEVVKGTPPYDRLTLGQLAAVIREACKRQPHLVCNVSESLLDDVGVRDRRGAPWYDRILFGAARRDISMPAALVIDRAGKIVFAYRSTRVDDGARPAEVLDSL